MRFLLAAVLLTGCAKTVAVQPPAPAPQVCVEFLEDAQAGTRMMVQVNDECQGGEAICRCDFQ